jgi:NAD(P) transhydrogenase subunit alpha
MYIGVLNESLRDTRVAVTPKAVQQYRKLGFSVLCEEGAYVRAGFTREALIEAGATVLTQEAILQKAELLLFISMPPSSLLEQVLAHACIIAPIDKDPQNEFLQKACANKVSVFSMNAIPRISRAQAMDSLSSQANIAGYKAVIEAAALYESVFPMMMTAAGIGIRSRCCRLASYCHGQAFRRCSICL